MCDEKWLQQLNDEFREINLDPKQRPFEALRRLSIKKGISVHFSSSVAQKIFNWFEKNTKPGIHNVGALFKSCYYFDATFWKITVPVIYGCCKLNALDAIEDMPESIKYSLISNQDSLKDYTTFWSNCVDFGYGFDDMERTYKENSFGLELLKAAREELDSAISMLLESRINKRAMLASRNATEIFLKSYLALKDKLNERGAKDISHDLEKSFDLFVEVSGDRELNNLKSLVSLFPEICLRYKSQNHKTEDIWQAFAFAQRLAAYLTREFTERDIRSQLFPKQNTT